MRILRTPETSRIKGVAPVWFKFKNFHGLGREKMGSVSLAPLHSSTGAAVHINQPKNRSFYDHKHTSKQKRTGYGCVSEQSLERFFVNKPG